MITGTSVRFKRAISFSLFVLSVFFLCEFSASAESVIPGSVEDKDSPIQIRGGAVEYFDQEKKAVGTGGVSIDYQGANLTADKITVYMESKRAIAEGHVVLRQKGSAFKGERAEYDFEKKIGYVSGMAAEYESTYYGKAQRIEQVSADHYRTVDSYVTTCCGDSPFYKIQAHEVDIYPEDKIVIRNAVMYVQNVPVLYIPYYVQYLADFSRLPVNVAAGKRSEWGPFILSKWRYTLVHQTDLDVNGNVLLDYRVKRGFGGGVETFYKGDRAGRGVFRYYQADDRRPSDDASSDRHRIQWRHQAKIGDATMVTAEMNKLSDRTVVKDFFFREEYERDAFPDNYVSIITAKPEYTLSFLDRERLNNFDSVVERSPEVRFDTHNRQFVDTPFYLRQEVQFSNLKKRYANTDDGMDVIRLDTNHTLSYAGHLGPVSVIPHIGTRQTGYSRDIEGGRSLLRGTADSGVDTSLRFYKTYDVYLKSCGLDYNQIRHIFSPTVSYVYRPNPTVSNQLLQQFDAIDAIDKQNFVRYSFENKLQTREHAVDGSLRTREIARIIPFLDTDLHTGHLENTGLRFELRPYTWMGIEGDSSYNSRTREIDTANIDIYFDRGPWTVGIGHRYVIRESSQMTAELRYRASPEWEYKVYERYEFHDSISREFEATASRTWSCVITDFIYNHREGADSFYFALRLKAFPQTPFSMSQSYNRPKASSIETRNTL